MKQQPRSSPRSARNQRTVSIIGTGSYTPEKILTNEDLSRMVDTSDDWITTRTGIKERRIAAKDETTSDMAAKAALKAIEQAKISPEEIDLLLVATATPDMVFPATACFVQKKIGAGNAACLDISAACAGFLFGLEIAQQFITSHTYDTVLVIGADKLTSITNWTDRNTCVLFGDGAGAAVLRHRGSAHGVISNHIGSDGQYSDILFMPGGGSRCPITRENVDMHLATIHMTGKEVYKQAVTAMLKAARTVLDQAGLSIEDIACVIPHQANLRIMEAIADRLGISRDKMFVNLDRYGNTSAAAVAIALDEANRTGRIKPGDYVLLIVCGGGRRTRVGVSQKRPTIKLMLIETHAHLDYPDFANDLDDVLRRANDAGVTRIITIGTSIESSRRAIALAEKYPAVYAAIGVHPTYVEEAEEDVFTPLRELAKNPRVVAIGETGLDYHRLPSEQVAKEKQVQVMSALRTETDEEIEAQIRDGAYKSKQASLFQQQLDLAVELGLNVVIHQRDAWDDTLEIMRPYKVRGVFHCFGGTYEQAIEVFDLGHLVSFTGIVTFKNGAEVREVAAQIRLDKFMV